MKRLALIYCMLLIVTLCRGQLKGGITDNIYIKAPEIETPIRFKIAQGMIYTGLGIIGTGIFIDIKEADKRGSLSSILNPNYKETNKGLVLLLSGSALLVSGVALGLDYGYKKRPITYDLTMNELKIIYNF